MNPSDHTSAVLARSFSQRTSRIAIVTGLLGAALALNCSGQAETKKEVDPPDFGPGGAGGTPTDMVGTGGDGMIDPGDLNLGGANGDSIEEIDLLFVIDNSVSMADKQELLRDAVPEMIRYLVDPPCIGDDGGTTTPMADGNCPVGTYRTFVPVKDIHIGVISSSLGGHGSRLCPRGEEGWNNDDQAHLIATKRPDVPSSDPAGFLTWTGGEATATEQLIEDFRAQVSSVGESGCGFEAPLEAWYRFLVDPQPPQEIVLNDTNRAVMATDDDGIPLIDEEVLAQREAFLRPKSLLNIIVLTDENDCSMMDGGAHYPNAGFGYLVAEASFQMPIATSVCETNPNDACCFSCLQSGSPPEGCQEQVSECESNPKIAPENDRANVRCFENKRRFGVDLLYPTDCYVDALSQSTIVDARTGMEVENPLLTGAGIHAGTKRPAVARHRHPGELGRPGCSRISDDIRAEREV